MFLNSSCTCCIGLDFHSGSGVQAESWAFAVDAQSLELLVGKGIFWTRTCKVCHGDEGIVVASEYGMSKAILDAGFNLATLMSRYAGPSAEALCAQAKTRPCTAQLVQVLLFL